MREIQLGTDLHSKRKKKKVHSYIKNNYRLMQFDFGNQLKLVSHIYDLTIFIS